jgi:subtilisin family serine protease
MDGILDRVGLSGLVELTRGRPEVVVGVVDGPVALEHPELADGRIRVLAMPNGCRDPGSASCRHGTFVTGILAARRGAAAPAIAPGCTYLVRPIFGERAVPDDPPTAAPRDLATAIVECVEAGARIINLSVALVGDRLGAAGELTEALRHTVRRGVLVFAAAGNRGVATGSSVTRHPWVVPVVGCTRDGEPMAGVSLTRAIGRQGLGAPGEGVTSLTPSGGSTVSAGSSFAAPLVTGAAALLWSLFPSASAAEIKSALSVAAAGRRSVVPPMLDARSAYEVLASR